MKKRLFNLGILLLIVLFNACEKTEAPSVSLQPEVFISSVKDTITIGDTTMVVGAAKDYEQGSDVIYKLTVSSELPLTKLIVTTNTDVFSVEFSRVLRTEPANAIDRSGNFVPGIKNVVVYYNYHIDDVILPRTAVNPVFSFQNESNYVGQTYDNFFTIKKGSTNGKLLKVQDLSWFRKDTYGIGNQEDFNLLGIGDTPDNNPRYAQKRGAFYSLDLAQDIRLLPDAITNADKVDFVGYFPRIAGKDPVMVASNYYLVSPSDSTVLGYSYAGSSQAGLSLTGNSGTGMITVAGISRPVTYLTNTTVTATNFVTAYKAEFAAKGLTLTNANNNLLWVAAVRGAYSDPGVFTNLTGNLQANQYYSPEGYLTFRKVLEFRSTIRQMRTSLTNGKTLKTTYYRRLDNLTGPNKMTAVDFDLLTHDNEYNTLLAGIAEEKNTIAGPMGFDQVYGFVTSDGKRGLIRTIPKSLLIGGVQKPQLAPNDGASDRALYCVIKYQQL